MSSVSHENCLNKIKQLIPPLTDDLHKGQCGRIGVVGGSIEYTGAPYFSAISALKTGADLIHVFCCKDAAPVIKSYSPELIVHPVLDSSKALEEINEWLDRLHVLVIGPGLGRQYNIMSTVSSLINHCKTNKSIPLVIDADGLFLLSENIDLIKGYSQPVILTPNIMELKRLTSSTNYLDWARDLNILLLSKGKTDVIYNGLDGEKTHSLECSLIGSNRRCGGQGDLLSGAVAVFLTWFHQANNKNQDSMNYSLAAYAGSCLIRECSNLAFSKHGRSMTTCDMIQEIHTAFTKLFT